MPLRSNLLRKCRPTIELPVLPFLAPRAFAPWPSWDRRVHNGNQTVQKYDTNDENYDLGPPILEKDYQAGIKEDSLLQRVTAENHELPKRSKRKIAMSEEPKISEKAWGNTSSFYEGSLKSTTDLSNAGLESWNPEFRRKYEEIWGSSESDKPEKLQHQAEEGTHKEQTIRFPHFRRVGAMRRRSSNQDYRKRYEEIWGSGPREKPKELQHQAEKSTYKKQTLKYPHSRIVRARQYTRMRKVRLTLTTIAGKDRARTERLHDANISNREADATPRNFTYFTGINNPNRQGKAYAPFRRVQFFPRSIPGEHHKSLARRRLTWRRLTSRGFAWRILVWRTRFGVLDRRRDRAARGANSYETRAHTRQLIPALESLIGYDSSKSINSAWAALPAGEQSRAWPALMLRALDKYPTQALKVLVATYTKPYPPGTVISDCLHYIISYFLAHRPVSTSGSQIALEIFRAIEHMLRLGPSEHFALSQASVYLLLQNMDSYAAGMLYKVLAEFKQPLHEHTLMHFASKLRLSGGADERMDLLRRLWRAGSDFRSPVVSSVCATLLQRKNRFLKATHSDSELFEFMLHCGLEPNIFIYNILVQNSVEVGDLETAWQIHDMMVQNGVKTDPYTYSILLTGSKICRDRESVRRVVNIVTEHGMMNSHIATDLLHTIFLFREDFETPPEQEPKGRSSNSFQRMLMVYRKYFSLEPLAHLVPGLGNVFPGNTVESSFLDTSPYSALMTSKSASASGKTLLDAAVPTLVIMLTALFREATEPLLVVRFYNQFCDLLNAGDPLATALAGSTHIYNIVLIALGKFPQTLAFCPRLIGDMLSQTTSINADIQQPVNQTQSAQTRLPTVFPSTAQPSKTAVKAGPERRISPSADQGRLHPKPDIHTWSILLKIFMDHKQPRAAEKVLAIMQDHGVYPNQVTWNSLVVGYGRLQDMSMTIDAVDRLKRDGYHLDEITMIGISYFQNRRALVDAMKTLEATNPANSRSKRPSAVSKTLTALKQTLRIIREGKEDAGLDSGIETRVDESNNDRGLDDDRGEETVAMVDQITGIAEFVVRDLPHIDAEDVDSYR